VVNEQDSSAFCASCGAKFDAPPSQAPMPNQSYIQSSIAAPKPSGVRPMHIIIGGSVLVGIALIAVLLVVLLGGNSAHDNMWGTGQVDPFIGTWMEDGGWQTIEFQSHGRGIVRDSFFDEPFEWTTSIFEGRNVVHLNIGEAGFQAVSVVEYRFMGNDILQIREFDPWGGWESDWWETWIRID